MMVKWKAASPECPEAHFHTEIYSAESIKRVKSGTTLHVKNIESRSSHVKALRMNLPPCAAICHGRFHTTCSCRGREGCSCFASPAQIVPSQMCEAVSNLRQSVGDGPSLWEQGFPLMMSWVQTGRNQLYLMCVCDMGGNLGNNI